MVKGTGDPAKGIMSPICCWGMYSDAWDGEPANSDWGTPWEEKGRVICEMGTAAKSDNELVCWWWWELGPTAGTEPIGCIE